MRTVWITRTVVLLALAGAGCDIPLPPPPAREPVPEQRRPIGEGPGGRPQELGMGPRKELAIGEQAQDEMLREYRGRVLSRDSAPARRARAVVERLAEAARIEPLQREINLRVKGYAFPWEVHVVKEKQVNAFCLPAGKMFVFTGLLAVTGDDDDFLATVMSHEMAHALAHHAAERVARANSPTEILGSMRHGRMQEEEADHIGVFLMAFAGYDPNDAPKFWQRMARATGDGGGLAEIFGDHPSSQSRIRSLASQAPRALAAKRAYDRMRSNPRRGETP